MSFHWYCSVSQRRDTQSLSCYCQYAKRRGSTALDFRGLFVLPPYFTVTLSRGGFSLSGYLFLFFGGVFYVRAFSLWWTYHELSFTYFDPICFSQMIRAHTHTQTEQPFTATGINPLNYCCWNDWRQLSDSGVGGECWWRCGGAADNHAWEKKR